MCICNNGENSKPPKHVASQYVTMVARLRDFVAWHSTWQIRSRHCKGSSLSSLIIDHWSSPSRRSQWKRGGLRPTRRRCTRHFKLQWLVRSRATEAIYRLAKLSVYIYSSRAGESNVYAVFQKEKTFQFYVVCWDNPHKGTTSPPSGNLAPLTQHPRDSDTPMSSRPKYTSEVPHYSNTQRHYFDIVRTQLASKIPSDRINKSSGAWGIWVPGKITPPHSNPSHQAHNLIVIFTGWRSIGLYYI